MSKTKMIIGALLVLILAGANAWQYVLKPDPIAPELTMTSITGEQIELNALRGKPVLISFWASSCGVCLAEIEDLVALHQQHHAQGYTTLAIALSYDKLDRVKALAAHRHLPYPVIYDAKGEYAKAFNGVSMTPTHFLISPEGKIVWKQVGMIDKAEVKALIAGE